MNTKEQLNNKNREMDIEKFITAKLNQIPEILKTWYDGNKRFELAKNSIADDIDRLTNDELAKGYCQFIKEKDSEGCITVTTSEHYKTRVIDLLELGSAICGIRFNGMDITKPFINLAVTTNLITAEGLAQAVPILQKEFADFNAKRIRVFIPNNSGDNLNQSDIFDLADLDKLGITAIKDRILIGNTLQVLIDKQQQQTLAEQGFELELVDFDKQPKFSKDYQQAYQVFHSQKPHAIDYSYYHDLENLSQTNQDGGFNFVLTQQGNFAGLLSLYSDTSQIAGVQGIYVNEKFIIPSLQGQGIGRQFESWVIQTLTEKNLASPDTVFFGEIDFNNKGSLHSAINNGRVEIGRWYWVE